jgi:putative membrane protein
MQSSPQTNVPESSGNKVILGIVLVSCIAIGFLFWLLYGRQASGEFSSSLTFLPALNAVLNGLSAIALCVGLYFIRRRNTNAHRMAMGMAFVFSSLFLVTYIVHHALHGDIHFAGKGFERTFYLSLLASHVIMSVVALPMVLTTFFFSLSGRFDRHKRLARFTFPIWLYVSVTGVIVYWMLSTHPA